MNIKLKKDKCNALYKNALHELRKYSEPKEICIILLEAATLLIEIGKSSPIDKPKCDKKAALLLNVSKELRKNRLHSVAYYDLTKDVLPPKENESSKENNKPDNNAAKNFTSAQKKRAACTEKNEIEDYQFEWNVLPKVSFDEIVGLEEAKGIITRKVLLPLTKPDIYDGYIMKNGGGVLFYGPPGTGKTKMAAAIAHEIGANFCFVGVSDLLHSGIGNSEKAIARLFEEARSFKRAVIYFEEIESICPATTRAQHSRQIRSEILRQIQGLDAYCKDEDKALFLIASTNKPWDVDSALIRPGRFGTKIYIGLPDESARRNMLETYISKVKNAGKVIIEDDIDIDAIVRATEGYSCADIEIIFYDVQEASAERFSNGELKVINQMDFEKVISNRASSVQKKDLEMLEKWKKENGYAKE